jgi:hypothetical protein
MLKRDGDAKQKDDVKMLLEVTGRLVETLDTLTKRVDEMAVKVEHPVVTIQHLDTDTPHNSDGEVLAPYTINIGHKDIQILAVPADFTALLDWTQDLQCQALDNKDRKELSGK